jgi:hypothetical protein
MADCKIPAGMAKTLRANTLGWANKVRVVIDAGIATNDNPAMLKEKGYYYIYVSRTSPAKHTAADGAQRVTAKDNKNQTIELERIEQKNTRTTTLRLIDALKL